MLELTTCPGCQAELAAPPIADSTSADLTPARLECPLCGTHFAPQPTKLRRIPAAKVAKPTAPPLRPTLLREPAPTLDAIEQAAVDADDADRETVLIPRQQSPTLELLPLELPVEPKPAAPERATVEREVAETVELPPLANDVANELSKRTTPTLPTLNPPTQPELPSEPVVAKESPALPSWKAPSSAEPKTPLTKLADLLDTPQLRPFVAAVKTESATALSPAPPLSAKPHAATMPEVKVFSESPSIAKTIDHFAPEKRASAESAAMLNRDFEFDLSTPEDSQGFNPFESEPADEPQVANPQVERAVTEVDPTELGWRVSRRLRNAAIVTMFTSACALGFLAIRPGSSAPAAQTICRVRTEHPSNRTCSLGRPNS